MKVNEYWGKSEAMPLVPGH